MKLVAIVGSLRQESFNRAVFNAATELIGADASLTELPLADVPLYDGDVEAAGDPEPVTALKQDVANADGLIVFTPEYNRGVPAVTKNAIDWLSRMPGDNVLIRTAVGVVAGTIGRHDAAGVRSHLSASLAMVDRFYETTLGLPSLSHTVVDGRLSDPDARQALETWLAAFVVHVEESAKATTD